MQEKNALVKSLVASHMLHENVHIPYKNLETNKRISPSKTINATSFVHLVKFLTVFTSLIFMKNNKQIPTKDAKSKHVPSETDVPSETNTFCH